MIARLLYWLAGIFGGGARVETQTMIPGLLLLLRALGVGGIGDLKQQGVNALKRELAKQLREQRGRIVTEALARLEKDGEVAKIPQAGPFIDGDGVSMNGRQYFVHQALWAIPRCIVGGVPSDLLRDDHMISWGQTEAGNLLLGVTNGRAAVEKVFDRLLEQML